MPLTIYTNEISPAAKRVELVCAEHAIAHTAVRVDFASNEHKRGAYLARNPFGQVPAMDDDGFALWDSRAIARYLATNYAERGAPLVPRGNDARAAARFEQALCIEVSQYQPLVSELVQVFFAERFHGAKRDEARVARLQAQLDEKLEVYEAILSKQKYLAGDEVTLADLFHLPEGQIVSEYLGLDIFKDKPNVTRWWKDISSRPSWQKVKLQL